MDQDHKTSKGFIYIEDQEPEPGEYCEIKVISYFKGWYMPECRSWSWLMDEAINPKTHVEAWKSDSNKRNY